MVIMDTYGSFIVSLRGFTTGASAHLGFKVL